MKYKIRLKSSSQLNVNKGIVEVIITKKPIEDENPRLFISKIYRKDGTLDKVYAFSKENIISITEEKL